MIAFPEVQRRAQAEIDALVGRDRLPTFADAPRLSYVCAIIKEILSWRPVAPFGMPHAATEEDWYEGMYIPKSTVCIPNAWHCNHDMTGRYLAMTRMNSSQSDASMRTENICLGPSKRTRQDTSHLALRDRSASARTWLLNYFS